MLARLKHKSAWISTLKYFIIFSIFYSLVKYVFRDQGEEFFSFNTFSKIIGFSLFMSLLFLLFNKPNHQKEEEVIEKRKLGYYAGFFLFMSLFLLVLGSILLLIGFIIFRFVSDEPLTAWHFLKPMIVLVAMAFLLTFFYFISDRIKLYKRR